MIKHLQERLNDCQEFMVMEKRSKKPSALYIADLEQTIKDLEAKIEKLSVWDGKPVRIMMA